MKCEICGKSSTDGATLYRQNPKGETGTWRCKAHVSYIPTDVVEIVDILENALKETHDKSN